MHNIFYRCYYYYVLTNMGLYNFIDIPHINIIYLVNFNHRFIKELFLQSTDVHNVINIKYIRNNYNTTIECGHRWFSTLFCDEILI